MSRAWAYMRYYAEIPAKINAQHEGQQYAVQDAAFKILGSASKQPLTLDKSPFIVFFEYGENREGYWADKHNNCKGRRILPGAFPCVLEPGDTQSGVFASSDSGPFSVPVQLPIARPFEQSSLYLYW
jgi:hypothetical protein